MSEINEAAAVAIRDRCLQHGYAMSLDTARDLAAAAEAVMLDELFTFRETQIILTKFAMDNGLPVTAVELFNFGAGL